MKLRGQLFLLKVGDGGNPEAFTTVAGQRTGQQSTANEPIDVTDKDGSRWRKLIEGGVRGATINARGLVSDADSYQLLCNLASQGAVRTFRLYFHDGLFLQGPFQVEKWGGEGEYDDSQQYEITLVGADDVALGPRQEPMNKGATFTGEGYDIDPTQVNDVVVFIPISGTITEATITSVGGPGSCAIDFRRQTFAEWLAADATASDSICGGSPLAVTNGRGVHDQSLAGWSLGVSAGDVITIHLSASSGFEELFTSFTVEMAQ